MNWATSFKEKMVLIAEDDEINRQMMGDIFEWIGCPVEFAVDGNEAVERFKKRKYDLIFMDIRMPNKDGITATREIRALEKGEKRVPIIALTASIMLQDKEGAIKAGIDDFIEKPIHLEEIRNKMIQYLSEKK